MKNKKTYITLLMGAMIVLSCSEEKLIDEVFKNVDRGLVLRTIATVGSGYDISDTSSPWGVTVEAQDAEDGKLLSEVRVFVSFVDNTIADGAPDLSTSEAALTTIPASSFTPGPFGFPRGDISATYAEAIAASGVALSDISGGDSFSFRLEGVMTDGRVYTNNANGTVTGGSFFSSPYAYVSTVVCPPTPPTPGEWTIEMVDSFGDGWNDATLVVTIDGTATAYTMVDGSALTVNFDVATGASVISIVYTAGDFDEEVSFKLFSANGSEILSLGPSPTVDTELLNYCLGDIL